MAEGIFFRKEKPSFREELTNMVRRRLPLEMPDQKAQETASDIVEAMIETFGLNVTELNTPKQRWFAPLKWKADDLNFIRLGFARTNRLVWPEDRCEEFLERHEDNLKAVTSRAGDRYLKRMMRREDEEALKKAG